MKYRIQDVVPSERKDPVKKIKNLIYQGKPLCPKSVKRGKCQIRSENHVTVLQGKRSTECTNKPLPQGQQTLISFPCHFRCPIGHFFVCLFGGGGSGYGPTAKIPHLSLPINTQSLGWEARHTGLGTQVVNRKAALSWLPKM